MKKMKKTVCVLSAIILSAANSLSVSAVYEPKVIDGSGISIGDVNSVMTEDTFRKSTASYAIDAGDEFLFKMQYDEEKEARKAIDNAVFTSSALITNKAAGDYEQLVIDENYRLFKVGSRMNYVYYKLAEGVKYSETPAAYPGDDRSMCVEAEPSCHGTIMEECVDSLCGALYNIDGIDPINDDLYYDIFNTSAEAEEYCRKLIDSGKVEYAHYVKKPFAVRYSKPDNNSKYSHGFSDEKFVFFMEFEDSAKAESFDVNSIGIFAKNLDAYFTEGNRIYFQLNDKEINQTTVDVLAELQNLEVVTAVSMVNNNGKAVSWWNHFEKKMGDVSLNEKLDLQDAVMLSKNLLGKQQFSEAQNCLADYDRNGKIELHDVIGVAKELAETAAAY